MPNGVSTWERLTEGVEPVVSDGPGIYDALRERLNPGLVRPAGSPQVSEFPLATRGGQKYYILANHNRYSYLRLGPEEQYLWSLMDGTRSVKDLVIEYFTKFGSLAFGLVAQLVMQLRHGYMLRERPVNVFAYVKRYLDRRNLRNLPGIFWQVLRGERSLMIRQGVDGVITWLYRYGGWILYTRPMQILYVALCLIGGWFFIQHATSGQFDVFRAGGSTAKGLLLLTVLNYFSIFVHEMAHALTTKHYGARVNGAGAILFFGIPAYFIDTTDIWTRPAKARMATSWAGPYSGLILAGLLSILIELFPGSILSPLLHRLAFLWIVILIFNLLPFIELDGYFILIDWLETPMLRQKSLGFLRKDLWRKLRFWEKWTNEERLFAAYGLVSSVFSLWVLSLGLRFWGRRSSIVSELWAGGIGSRIVLVIVVPALFLPLLTSLAVRVLGLGRAATGIARTAWARTHLRAQREREDFLRQVRFLSPLSDEKIHQVAARLQRTRYRMGEQIIRQGEEGDRFYLVESGQAEVVVDNARIRVLHPGDYFGEVALLYRVPRTATVQAVTPLTVLWLRKGDFDYLLASDVVASTQIGDAIKAVDHLRHFRIFDGLTSSELDGLAAHLHLVQVPGGHVIFNEGDPGDAFYLIESGQAEVNQKGKRVVILGPGDYFGEIALILDVPRTATVRALTPLEVWALDAQDFDAFIGQYMSKLSAVEMTARERFGAIAMTG